VEEANVQERVISQPISDAWLMEWKNRHRILSALSTIIRYWYKEGKPLAKDNLRAGYEGWCQVYGGLVQFAGFGDCLAQPSEVETEVNTEIAHMKSLVKAMAEALLRDPPEQRVEWAFQDIVNVAHEEGLFSWALDGKEDTAGSFILTSKAIPKVGRILNRYAPRMPGARVFRITPTKTVRVSTVGSNRHKRFVFELSMGA
jgi:hypothetical protein